MYNAFELYYQEEMIAEEGVFQRISKTAVALVKRLMEIIDNFLIKVRDGKRDFELPFFVVEYINDSAKFIRETGRNGAVGNIVIGDDGLYSEEDLRKKYPGLTRPHNVPVSNWIKNEYTSAGRGSRWSEKHYSGVELLEYLKAVQKYARDTNKRLIREEAENPTIAKDWTAQLREAIFQVSTIRAIFTFDGFDKVNSQVKNIQSFNQTMNTQRGDLVFD